MLQALSFVRPPVRGTVLNAWGPRDRQGFSGHGTCSVAARHDELLTRSLFEAKGVLEVPNQLRRQAADVRLTPNGGRESTSTRLENTRHGF